MRAQLLCRSGPGSGLTFTFGDVARIGRDNANEVALPLEGISRLHATVSFTGGSFWIEDAGSMNGTLLNGRRINRERLNHLDVVTLGVNVDLLFLARVSVAEAPVRRGIVSARLVAADGPDSGMTVEIPKGVVTIGRTTACNVVLESQAISKMHARIERTSDQLVLVDLGSSNGTFVNGMRVSAAPLAHGDRVVFGAVREFRVEVDTGTLPGVSFPPGMMAGVESKTRIEGIQQGASSKSVWRMRYDFSPGENVEEEPKDRAGKRTVPEGAGGGATRRADSVGGASRGDGTELVAKQPAPPVAPRAVAPAPAPPLPVAKAPVAPVVAVAPIAPAPAPLPSTVISPPPSAAPQAGGPIVEVILSGPGGTFRVGHGAHTVGRMESCTIPIKETKISRQHATIDVTADGAVLKDLGSANGTFVNGERISAPRPLVDGDNIVFAEFPYKVSFRRG